MNRKRIFAAAGTCALAVVSLLAISATKKRTSVTNLYYDNLAGNCVQISSSSIFTTAGTGSKIQFNTAAGTSNITVYSGRSSATTCTNPVTVYLK
jgi:hypothetical protein